MYNHACTLAFEVVSQDKNGDDFTPEMLRAAILRRLELMSDSEIVEAVGGPYDTYALEEDATQEKGNG